jgi:flagellar biosynthesis protein FliR
MEAATERMLVFMMILGRISGFFAIIPVFGFKGMPMPFRVALAILVSFLFTSILPAPAVGLVPEEWLALSLVMVREILTGVALGLAVALVFSAVNQAGEIFRMQMGMADAEIIDPLMGEDSQPMGMLLEMAFLVLFLVAGGHQLLLSMIMRSYDVFPIGQPPSTAIMYEAVLESGAMMLIFGLKLAAPILAAFLLLAVVLAVMARALPEMNVLMVSLPLRVGLGFFLAAAMVPSLGTFTEQIGDWLNRFMTG